MTIEQVFGMMLGLIVSGAVAFFFASLMHRPEGS